MRKLLLSSAWLLVCFWGIAQSIETPDIAMPSAKQLKGLDSVNIAKPTLRMQAGTAFMFSPGVGGVLSHYVAPELGWQLTPKFTLSTGVMLGFSSFNSINNNNAERRAMVPFAGGYPAMQTTAYVAGEYAVNPKLSLTGRVFTDIARMDLSGTGNHMTLNTYGGAAGFKLKVNERTHIMAEIQLQSGNNPYPNIPNSDLSRFSGNRMGPWGTSW